MTAADKRDLEANRERFQEAAIRLVKRATDLLDSLEENGFESTYSDAAMALAATHEMFAIASWIRGIETRVASE